MLSGESPDDPFHSPYRHQVPERFEKAVKILYADICHSAPGWLPAVGNSRQAVWEKLYNAVGGLLDG
jgi:hypothetical protein